MSMTIYFLVIFFFIRAEGTTESLKVKTRKFHGSWEERNRRVRAGNDGQGKAGEAEDATPQTEEN